MTRETKPPDQPGNIVDDDLSLSSQPEENHTRVDLGDDLISGRGQLDKKEKTEVTLVVAGGVADQLESARILQSEGLTDEAKKTLRRLLVSDPHNIVARKALQSIHAQELQSLLKGSGGRSEAIKAAAHFRDLSHAVREEVIADLDRDLGLGLLEPGVREEAQENLEKFLSDLESMLSSVGLAKRDRIDLGIAYLEMGSPQVAEHCFRAARQEYRDEIENAESRRQWLSATALLAQAQLRCEKPLEALGNLQEALKSSDVFDVELVYLTGRSLEALGRPEEAAIWYGKACAIDPTYRDVVDRLRQSKS
ncbi:MAG: tetratricopeptide repeat protein [Oligoflexia bacterium]|nr:tetratricopeptide repeat protein [Oligoflexia bacterium]